MTIRQQRSRTDRGQRDLRLEPRVVLIRCPLKCRGTVGKKVVKALGGFRFGLISP